MQMRSSSHPYRPDTLTHNFDLLKVGSQVTLAPEKVQF